MTDPPAKKRVVILGAGSSGLSVAWGLMGNDHYEVTILERSAGLGGLSRTLVQDGIRFDIGPHRLSPQLPGVVERIRGLLGEDLLELENEHGVFFRGTLYKYPPGLADLLRPVALWYTLSFGASWIADRALAAAAVLARGSRELSFEEVLVQSFGRRFCTDVIFPMIEKVWGTRDLHADFARLRFETPTIAGVIRRLMSRKGHPGNRYFYYPREGYGQIFDSLGLALRQAGITLELRAAVRSIGAGSLDGPFSVSYSCDGRERELEADLVVSTVSNRDLLGYLAATGLVSPLLRERPAFSSRTLRMGVMVVRDYRLPSRIIIFPEADCIFNRISDMSQFARLGNPETCAVLLVDIVCEQGGEFDTMPEDAFNRRLREAVLSLGWFPEDRVVKMFSVRVPDAYPVLDVARYRAQEAVERYFDGTCLLLCGREASSDYNNSHNAIGKGLLTADYVMGKIGHEEFLRLSRLIGRLPIQD